MALSILPITGANVWHGKDMAGSPRWQRRLTPAQLAEIDTALAVAKSRGVASWEAMTAADFPLPGLAPLFDDIREELENGSGLLMLRGIDPARYTLDDAKTVYAGIARQLGTLVFSNRGGEIMREIRDVGRDVGKRYGELNGGTGGTFLSSYSRTLSNGSLRYHTDRCDVVSLFCIRQAMTGGVSKLCSSPAVHNAMLERRPELCAALHETVWRSRFGEEDEGDTMGYALPVWGVRDGKFTSHYSRTFVEAGQRRPEAPRVSAAQWEALDLLSDLADELSFEMSFAPGDIQFVNNHVVYHARTEFEDDPAAGRDRLLLRLWMAMPNSRALPKGHEVLWRAIEAGAPRGGIGQTAAAPLR